MAISSLFSFGNNNSFGFNALAGLDFNTLSSIHNGSYKKLLRAYYDKQNNANDSKSTKTNNVNNTKTTSKEKTNALNVKEDAKAVNESIDALDKASLWKKTTVKNEDGTTREDYDKDAIYKAVSSFVKDYNALLDSAGKSNDISVLRTTTNMVGKTKANKDFLEKIGISVGVDNKLTVNEDEFKQSSMLDVKDTFKGSGSYGDSIEASASMIYGSAGAQIARYSSYGMYSNTGAYSYQNGSYFNQFF